MLTIFLCIFTKTLQEKRYGNPVKSEGKSHKESYLTSYLETEKIQQSLHWFLEHVFSPETLFSAILYEII